MGFDGANLLKRAELKELSNEIKNVQIGYA
jgi:hypothetical protein